MRVIETVADMRAARRELTGKVVLVATLGGMHAGHEAHLSTARDIGGTVVGSLFLNPTQFGASEDLGRYPHDRQKDLAVFEKHGTAVVFAPPVAEMYPPGDTTTVDPGPIGSVLEGAHRPGHFKGVATVVTKIFAIIRPDAATFGEKDAQQLRIIRKLNRELGFGIEIVPIPTVREPDGLACSSRNAYLGSAERRAAPVLYQALCGAKRAWDDGERGTDTLRQAVAAVLSSEPLVAPDYVSAADPDTLVELQGSRPGAVLVSLAARIGSTRLIDNILLS